MSEQMMAAQTTVLVIDDVPHVREHICRMLAPEGYTILEARDAAHALDLCRTHPDPIHLLITDIRMPDMNGLALADQACAIRPDLRVLYISGYGADELTWSGNRRDERYFLPKPFGAPILLEKIRGLLVGG